MKKLQINWMDLGNAFVPMQNDRRYHSETSGYIDTLTGQVVDVDETVSNSVERIIVEIDEVVDEDADWTEEDVCRTESYKALSECEKPHVLASIRIEYGNSTDRYEQIPQFDSDDTFEWMEDFIETVRDEVVRERLSTAINQRKPFRNFREAIGSDRRLQQQWRAFESARQREAIIDWLGSIDVEPLNPDDSTFDPPPLPELRMIMFAEVRRFVRLASDIPGVHRIALIGSLASDKEFPKDIDMLITISDDCDLTGLALLGRQLAGHMASHGSGADVFLTNQSDQYLGRICSWKHCGPGIRTSCDARSCGVRHYLHDDLATIHLGKELLQHPPVLLWPEIAATSAAPPDVLEHLIHPLSQDPL